MQKKKSKEIPGNFFIILLPLLLGVFSVYFIIGAALPVIPVHVNMRLGFGRFVVGVIAGSQFAFSLVSRFWSGGLADRLGGKRTMSIGIVIALVSGLFYSLSVLFLHVPLISLVLLLAGRALLGGAESFIISGALVWGMSRAGMEKTGKVFTWVGTAMYLAFALGSPLGSFFYNMCGFYSIALGTIIIPVVALLVIVPSTADQPAVTGSPSIVKVLRSVAVPGSGLALSSIGFSAMTTFAVLLFIERGWSYGAFALTVFAGAFVLARVLCGHFIDYYGGARIALVSALVESLGLLIIWIIPVESVALLGAGIAGFGYSLIYPAFGVEAVRLAPVESKGLATGSYSAFLDIGLGVANPALGYLADLFTVDSVFGVGALVSLGVVIISLLILSGRRSVAGN
jgi:MFS family permease